MRHGPLPERTTDQLWLFRPEDCQVFPLEGSQSVTRVTATLQLEVSVLERRVPRGGRPATPGQSRREQPLPLDVLTREAVRSCAGAAGVARCTELTRTRPPRGPCAPWRLPASRQTGPPTAIRETRRCSPGSSPVSAALPHVTAAQTPVTTREARKQR
uniref:Uncharacterized protein n=1 Tax=Rangifer tarandus platyrhynchus TaxID=3082113 RepID=A0ACB0DPT1_RANTA|nr:unnamed protein product [Rangifer tarandus platyrhynchus]